MEILPYIYFAYMFIALYFLSLYFLIYLRNKKDLFSFPELKKNYSISFLVPAFNESKTLADTIEHIFNIDYENITEVIIINDCSKDNTLEIANSLKAKYPKLIVLDNKINLGKAGSLNRALKIAKGELVAVVDADSYPAKESVKRMAGFFEDEKVGAVTCPIVARNTNLFFEKLQAIEYRVIALTRKLLDYVDAIYVTPGPLALYRKTALLDINGFDQNNLTEDIEATWHLTNNHWKRKMCLSASVSSTVPSKLVAWYKQRRRWTIGGLQCISKYKKEIFKRGMLGMFVLPFFIVQFFLGLLGLGVFFYLGVTSAITNYLFATYSINANVPLLTMNQLYITPSFLNYLGLIIFSISIIFTLISLAIMKKTVMKKENVFNIFFFAVIYLMTYPFITLVAVYKYFKRENKWR